MNIFELICIITGLAAGIGAFVCFFAELFLENYDKSRKAAFGCICVGLIALLAFTIETVIRVYMGTL